MISLHSVLSILQYIAYSSECHVCNKLSGPETTADILG